jgi:hypothetical protein
VEPWTFGGGGMIIVYGTMTIVYRTLNKLLEPWIFGGGTLSIFYGNVSIAYRPIRNQGSLNKVYGTMNFW